jgi:UDP-N-acetylmuramate dehydrogenase
MPRLQENVSLAKYSHYKIGGPARFFLNAKTEKDIMWAVREAKKRKLKIFILAGGTNILMSDKGFDGLVIRPDIQTMNVRGTTVRAGAGVSMADLLSYTAKASLDGLSWAGGLPGTLGGAIRGNAGCFGGEIKDVITSVRSLNLKTMKIMQRSAKECRFSYRDSIFKNDTAREIILGAALHCARGNKKEILASAREKIEYRKKHHPLEYPNIGSTFKNVSLADIYKKGGLPHRQAITAASMDFKGSKFSVKMDPFPVVSAAKMISESGLRGISFGGAMISPKHPNFIVNALEAKASDVAALIKLAKAEVFKRFGVQLEEEIQIV